MRWYTKSFAAIHISSSQGTCSPLTHNSDRPRADPSGARGIVDPAVGGQRAARAGKPRDCLDRTCGRNSRMAPFIRLDGFNVSYPFGIGPS